ncbi:MAG: adenosylcobinamide-GDP ribazoletransferase [Cyanobacteria bacterium P01_H01_bin.15]
MPSAFILKLQELWPTFLGGLAFYTILPLPRKWPLNINRCSLMAPLIGLIVGGLLGQLWGLVQWVRVPQFLSSALLVGAWVLLTGGLHLDGAMDTADGWNVNNPRQRLSVMQDSRTGAFGVMVCVVLLGLKISALAETSLLVPWILAGAAGWARWSQVVAIAVYPYLRGEGKGKLHKDHCHVPGDWLWGLVVLLIFLGIQGLITQRWWASILLAGGGGSAGILFGWLIYWRFGGHTGDTYGAVVEWSETFYLCLACIYLS